MAEQEDLHDEPQETREAPVRKRPRPGERRLQILQTLANMLERFGVAVPAADIKIENVAAVLVTADLPPYARPGSRIDITASSIGQDRLAGDASFTRSM